MIEKGLYGYLEIEIGDIWNNYCCSVYSLFLFFQVGDAHAPQRGLFGHSSKDVVFTYVFTFIKKTYAR